MFSNIYILLAFLILFIFATLMIFTIKDKNKLYINYVLLGSPLLSIKLLPSYGYPSIFEFTILLFYIFFYKKKHNQFSFILKYNILIIILFISLTIGIFYLNLISFDTFYSFIQILCLFLFAKLIIEECFNDTRSFNNIILNLKLLITLSLIFLFFQFIFGPSFSFEKSPNINILQGYNIRYPSYYQDPQKYAQFLAAGFFISLINFKDFFLFKFGNYILCFTILIAIFFTGGRAAFIGLIFSFFILFLLIKSNYKFIIVTLLIFVFILVRNYLDYFALFNRESTFSESYNFRNSIWKDALDIFYQYPFFGIGISNYEKFVKIYNPDQFWISNNIITYYDHPESGYLKILVEYGLIGFICFFLLILIPVYNGFKYFLLTQDLIILFLILSIITWLIGFVTVYSLSDNRISIFITSVISLLIVRPFLNETE